MINRIVLGLGAIVGAWPLLAATTPLIHVGNEAVRREISVDGGTLRTTSFDNLRAGKHLALGPGDEFTLTYSMPRAAPVILTNADFIVTATHGSEASDASDIKVMLKAKRAPIALEIRYWANRREPWMRKTVRVTAQQEVEIGGIDIERLALPDAYQPYHAAQFTAVGHEQWRPPLGQPVYGRRSGAWWGVEFPAAHNRAADGVLTCGYLTRQSLKPGEALLSHPAVCGVADDADFVPEAFLEYIDATRARPLRLQTQYNSWFDYGSSVAAEKFMTSVATIHRELVVKRGVDPLRAYVIDDGWEDTTADWTKTGVWPVNSKFDGDFAQCRAAVAAANSHLGLWLSPGCLFGAEKAIPRMKTAGWRVLDPWMSMTGEAYMAALEQRMVSLASSGISYFKLDGLFGHLNKRNFDVPGFRGGEPELNDARFDEQKERYLSLGTERLVWIFQRMGAVNPDLYLVISNGAFLSPWWLQSVDAVWMINAGDAARGANRNGELVYRDARYFQLTSATRDNTQFPLDSIFNHEPKKTDSGESAEQFSRYLHLSLSRGTSFVELYLKTARLSESDWDALADGLKWVRGIFPDFKRAHMIGGDPTKNELYGYTGWSDAHGYVALHNSADQPAGCTLTLDRNLGLTPAALSQRSTYRISSPIPGDAAGLPELVQAGEELTVNVPPQTVRILEFSRSNL